jgi:hypothetical protein
LFAVSIEIIDDSGLGNSADVPVQTGGRFFICASKLAGFVEIVEKAFLSTKQGS